MSGGLNSPQSPSPLRCCGKQRAVNHLFCTDQGILDDLRYKNIRIERFRFFIQQGPDHKREVAEDQFILSSKVLKFYFVSFLLVGCFVVYFHFILGFAHSKAPGTTALTLHPSRLNPTYLGRLAFSASLSATYFPFRFDSLPSISITNSVLVGVELQPATSWNSLLTTKIYRILCTA